LVQIKIYDVLGNELFTLVNEFKSAGKHKVYFNANNLSSGIYYYEILTPEFKSVKKMLLVK